MNLFLQVNIFDKKNRIHILTDTDSTINIINHVIKNLEKINITIKNSKSNVVNKTVFKSVKFYILICFLM